jgi:glycoside/pentoside/hexuronide:cation symporter, GPH family
VTDNARPDATGRLKLSTVLTFSTVTLPGSALGLAVSIYLTPYLAGHLGVNLKTIGAAFFIVRLLDIPVDPILGVVMDRTRTVLGRYRLWLLIGAPIFMISVYQLLMAKPGIDEAYLVLWLLVQALGTSIEGLAQGAWSATLATGYNERSRLFSVLTMVGVAANVIVLAIPIVGEQFGLTTADCVHLMGWLAIGLTPICVGLVAWRVPEKIAADVPSHRFPLADYWALVKKPAMLRLFFAQAALQLGPGWMSALYIFFFRDVLGFSQGGSAELLIIYIMAAIVGAPTTAWVSSRFGKHRTLMVTTTAYSLGLCTIFFLPVGQFFITGPVMFWCGFMASGFGLLTSSMTADVGDEVRLEQGKQRMSLIYSMIGLANKLAGAAQFFLSLYLLAWVGYDAKDGAHNTAAAIKGLEYIYILGPIFFVMLGGACFIGWKLDAKRHGEIQKALEIRDAALGEAAVIGGLTGHPLPVPGE